MDIATELRKAKIGVNEHQENQLNTMIEFLQEYSQKVNLTAIKDREGIIEKHLIDSILPLTLTSVDPETTCADIGTGAGFPALPMMVYRPDLKFTLVDALKKRTVYLEQACEKIGVEPVEILHYRAEEMGRSPLYREHFGMVTARAVSSLRTLSEYCLPLLKLEGLFLAMRGSTKELDDDAVRAIHILGGKVEGEIEYKLPNGDGRRLIVVRKKKHTPTAYPRTAAAMAKSEI